MKIALLMNLAPRKLGSFEAWLLAFCKEAMWRGHRITLFGRKPVHLQFATDLSALGVDYQDLQDLEADPVGAVRTLSTFDVLHLDMVAPRSRAALAAYAAWPARVLFVAHSDHLPDATGGAKRLVRKLLDRASSLRINGFAGVSDFVREKERVRFGLSAEKCRTLYNGVDVDRFRPPAESERDPNKPLELVTVAYLIRAKGVHVLLAALARLEDQRCTLTVVGDGPEEQALRAQARSLGLESRVSFLGLRDDVPALVSRADVFVHNATAEAFGFTIAEAMAAGRPVVATRVGGVPEVVEDGVSGLLVPPGDVDALAQALSRVVSDAGLRQTLGENARARCRQRFSIRGSVTRHLDFCDELVAGRAPRSVEVSDILPVTPTQAWPSTVPGAPEIVELPTRERPPARAEGGNTLRAVPPTR